MANSSWIISNDKMQFLDGFAGKVSNTAKLFTVCASESRSIFYRDWSPITHTLEINSQYFEIKFHKPSNASNFKLEIESDTGIEAINSSAIPTPTLTDIEVADLMRGKQATFLACARQCAGKVQASLEKIQSLGSLFGDYRILVFENDSTDNTVELLNSFLAKMPLQILREEGLSESIQKRTARLAYIRNTLLRRAQEHQTDFIIWIDLDGLIDEKLPTKEGFISNFKYLNCWDAVFPVNAGIYYDIWALRHPTLCPGDYTTRGHDLDAALGLKLGVHFAATHLQVDFRELKGWLPVESAFGGMGIYKSNIIMNKRYRGIEYDREICEHVAVNSQIAREGGLLLINPSFIIHSHK